MTVELSRYASLCPFQMPEIVRRFYREYDPINHATTAFANTVVYAGMDDNGNTFGADVEPFYVWEGGILQYEPTANDGQGGNIIVYPSDAGTKVSYPVGMNDAEGNQVVKVEWVWVQNLRRWLTQQQSDEILTAYDNQGPAVIRNAKTLNTSVPVFSDNTLILLLLLTFLIISKNG